MFSFDDIDIYFKICQVSGIHSKNALQVWNIILMKTEDKQMQSFLFVSSMCQSSEAIALKKFSHIHREWTI